MLYAEIHSPLPPIPNLLNNKLPEIIADAPRRINRNQKLLLLVLIKDSHLYPLELVSITAEITQAGARIQSLDLWKGVLPLAQRYWSRLFVVDPGTRGRIEIDVIITVRRKDRLSVIKNQSYAPIKKMTLDVFISFYDGETQAPSRFLLFILFFIVASVFRTTLLSAPLMRTVAFGIGS